MKIRRRNDSGRDGVQRRDAEGNQKVRAEINGHRRTPGEHVLKEDHGEDKERIKLRGKRGADEELMKGSN